MHVRFGCLLALFGAGALAGCTLPGDPSPDEIRKAQQGIINGNPSGTEDDTAVLIPLFQNGNLLGNCSGSLIAANLVLTARHCVSNTDESGTACDSEGNTLGGGEVLSDRKPSDIGVIVGTAIKGTLDAKGTQFFTTGADTLCNNDIAIVLLDTALTDAPIAQVRLDGPVMDKETFRVVGWGVSNNSNGFERRERDDVPILHVGPYDYPNAIDGIPVNEFESGEASCSGDSGGPAYDEATRAVIGVVSRGGNGRQSMTNPTISCTDSGGFVTSNIFTRIGGFGDVFTQAFAAAGTDPWREGGPDPRKPKLGGPCMAGSDCQSGICVDADKTGYCSEMCDGTPESCGGGNPYSCQKDGDLQLCELPHSHGCEMSHDNATAPAWIALAFLAFAIARRRRARA